MGMPMRWWPISAQAFKQPDVVIAALDLHCEKSRNPSIQTGEMNGGQRSGKKNAVADYRLIKSPAVFTSGAF